MGMLIAAISTFLTKYLESKLFGAKKPQHFRNDFSFLLITPKLCDLCLPYLITKRNNIKFSTNFILKTFF